MCRQAATVPPTEATSRRDGQITPTGQSALLWVQARFPQVSAQLIGEPAAPTSTISLLAPTQRSLSTRYRRSTRLARFELRRMATVPEHLRCTCPQCGLVNFATPEDSLPHRTRCQNILSSCHPRRQSPTSIDAQCAYCQHRWDPCSEPPRETRATTSGLSLALPEFLECHVQGLSKSASAVNASRKPPEIPMTVLSHMYVQSDKIRLGAATRAQD